MKWSWKLGRVFGIDLFMHATFLILIAWVGFSHYVQERTMRAALGGVVFVLAVFGSVVLHELGHALTARRFGIRTRDITLYPIGGIARLERMPDKPSQELVVALAGPAVNVAIATSLFVALTITQGPMQMDAASLAHLPFLARLMLVNVSLAVFNLLPAFPMDGGRALRALLAMRFDYVRATRMAAGLGQMMALLLGLVGLFFNPMLALIAVFVWMGAGAEAAGVQAKSALAGLPVRAAMIVDFRTLAPGDSLATAVEQLLLGSQHDFPVLDHGALAGVLTRSQLLQALAQSEAGTATPVGEVMSREVITVDPSDTLEQGLARLQESDCPTLPVVRHGQVVGLLTMENLGELLMVQTALAGNARARAPHAWEMREREAR